MNFKKQLNTRTLRYEDDKTCYTFLNVPLLFYNEKRNIFLENRLHHKWRFSFELNVLAPQDLLLSTQNIGLIVTFIIQII